MLSFARKTMTALKPMDMSKVVRECLNLLRASIPTMVEMKSIIPPNPLMILGDPTEIHQIVINLCNNAAHAMREKGGKLEVDLSLVSLDKDAVSRWEELKPGDFVKLTIKDSGEGMTSDVLKKVFEPYFTTKEFGEGTGMGLAVVHGIVSSCDGFVTVASAGPGHGTIFQIFLPAVAMQEPESETLSESLPGGNEHILFIDDEPDIVEVANEMLTALGYRVTAMHKSQQALEIFERSPRDFDLVITDRTMPKMAGLELAGRIRALRPEIPIILCSGYGLDLDEESIQGREISAALAKPLNFKNIAETIRAVLDEKSSMTLLPA